LRERADEVPRISDEYARDAFAEFAPRETSFRDRDPAWILAHAATSLSEIEKATLRLVALRASANMSNAAARLGMAPVSLSRWISRRSLGRVLAAT
jgi:ActR/RegA family two-component response regulator